MYNCTLLKSLTTLLTPSQSLSSVAQESLPVLKVFVSVKRGAVMETTTAETGQMRPTAQVMTVTGGITENS